MMNQPSQCGTAVRPPSQIDSHQAQTDGAIRELNEAVLALQARLVPVLRPCGPVTNSVGPQKISEMLVPIAQHESEQCEAVKSITTTVNDLLQRLET